MLFFFAFANVIVAQTITVDINNLGNLNPGTQTIQVTYQANGDFQASDGTDDWGGQVLTLGWTPASGMNESQPAVNTNITNFTTDFLPFVGAFSGTNQVVTWSLMDLGGTDDGNIYFSVVVNTSTVDQPLADGSIVEVFRFDVPDSWTGPDGSVFLLPNQPTGPPVQLAPKIDNNGVGANVWDGANAGAPLPIELSYFNVRKQGDLDALLSWETIFEIDASHFEIQRSQSIVNWTSIETIKSRGSADNSEQYHFTDVGIGRKSNLWYYRLKMFDQDGSYKFSDIKGVRFDAQEQGDVSVFPNPCIDFVNIQSNHMSLSELYIYSMDGRLMFEQKLHDSLERIKVDQLPAGTYQLVLMSSGEIVKRQSIIIIE